MSSLGIATANASDNSQLFSDAYHYGKSNQFNLNLNANSTINSYTANNKIESTYSNNANAGTTNSRQLYNSGTQNVNNLSQQGINDLADCTSKSDPRCSSLNKYSDKDTQTGLQAYSHVISQAYYIHTRPDPQNSSCTLITTKKPINPSTQTCIASAHQQTTCSAKPIISVAVNNYQCNPTNNGCQTYQNNPLCNLVQDYQPTRCHYTCDSSNHGTSNGYCPYWDDVGTDAKNNQVWGSCQVGKTYYCGNVKQTITCGTNVGQPSPKWHVFFSACIEHPAIYSCREPSYSYSDECAGKL